MLEEYPAGGLPPLPQKVETFRICEECNSFRVCQRCSRGYCGHHASKIDFQFCEECFKSFQIEDSIIRKTVVSTSLSGKKTFTRVMRARLIVLKGEDWLFAQRRIPTMSTQDLADSIEYHHTIVREMMHEYEARRIAEHRKKFAKSVGASGASLKIPASNGYNTDGSPMTVTTTTVKRTKVRAAGNSGVANLLDGVTAMLRAQGYTDDQIKAKILSLAGVKS